jgi:hypothetical protein
MVTAANFICCVSSGLRFVPAFLQYGSLIVLTVVSASFFFVPSLQNNKLARLRAGAIAYETKLIRRGHNK